MLFCSSVVSQTSATMVQLGLANQDKKHSLHALNRFLCEMNVSGRLAKKNLAAFMQVQDGQAPPPNTGSSAILVVRNIVLTDFKEQKLTSNQLKDGPCRIMGQPWIICSR